MHLFVRHDMTVLHCIKRYQQFSQHFVITLMKIVASTIEMLASF